MVVGAGPSGGWAAMELCARGLTVLVLEAGPELDPKVDFRALRSLEEIRTREGMEAATLARQQIQSTSAVYYEHTRHFFVDDLEHPYSTPEGKPFVWIRARRTGGRGLLWGRACLRFSDLDFAAHLHDGFGEGWPLTYAEVAPYYDRVERFLEVPGTGVDLPQLPAGCNPGPASLTPEEQKLKARIEQKWPERRVLRSPQARNEARQFPSMLQAAMNTGRATLRANAIAERVEVDPSTGRAKSVVFVDRLTGARHELHSRVVLLCASPLETVRLMLNSAGPACPMGLGNSSGLLGRYLMDHVASGAFGVVRGTPPRPVAERFEREDPYDMAQMTAVYIPRFSNVEQKDPRFLRGFAIQGQVGRGAWAASGLARHGTPFTLMALGEVLPRPENRITLAADRPDAFGIPTPLIEFKHSENETAMLAAQIEALKEVAEVAGLEIAFRPLAQPPGASMQELGGARMGREPSRSVLNPSNQCWDVPNLCVLDGASFPTAPCQGTTLTILALAARACDRLCEALGRGEL